MESQTSDWEEILAHYSEIAEDQRLFNGYGVLELARSQVLLERHLPRPPGTLLDVGGGPGIYSCWLALKGYEVRLIDPVEKHLDQAKKASNSQPSHPIESIRKGEARSLSQAGLSCDGILLFGPLYHLTRLDHRMAALREAHRVLRQGGLAFVAGINRFASLIDGLGRGLIDDPYFVEILERDLREGQHLNPKNVPDYFTTAHLHRPKELESEVSEAGFKVIEVVAIEGPGWLAEDFFERWRDTVRREQLLKLIQAVEKEPSLIGMSQHFMIIARK